MFLIREVMQCKPGKVRDMVNKFKGLNVVAQRLGYQPFRLFTDVSGEPFWTVVAESEVESLNAFLEMEEKVMAEDDARKAMAGYHDLVENGRREIYRVEG
jgi:hypothetical protein